MPQVPKYGIPRVEPTGLPDGSLTTTHDGGAAARAWGQALDQVGQAAERLGLYHLEKAKNERRAAERNNATARLYDVERYALTSRDRGPAGPDGQPTGAKGLLNQTGLEPDENLQAVMGEVDVQIGELASTMTDPEDKAWFRDESQRVRAGIERRGLEHASTERTKHRKNVFEAAIDGSRNRVGLHAASGPAGRAIIAEEIEKTTTTLRASGPEFGLTGPLLEDAIAAAVGQIHVAATQGLLTARQHGEAATYWAANREQVPDQEIRTRVDENLKNRTTDALALETVDQVWGELGPKNDRGLLEQDKLEARVRELTRGDTDRYKAALAELHVRMQAHKNAKSERNDQFVDPLLLAIIAGKSTGEVMRMPEWGELDADERKQIWQLAEGADAKRQAALDRIDDRNWTQRQREIAIAEQVNFARYQELSDETRLRGVTDRNQIRQEAASLMPAKGLADALLTKWDQLHRPDATPASTTLPDEIWKGVFTEMGSTWVNLPVTQWGGTARRQERAAFVGRVQSAAISQIDAEQRANNNKPLTIERKKEIVKEILSTSVMVKAGGLWSVFSDAAEAKTALEIDPSGPEAIRARVPLERLRRDEPALLADLVKELRINGRNDMDQPIVRPGQAFSDEDIIRVYQDRIEWAAALRYIQAPDALDVIRTGRRSPR